jgi:DNA processing protein
MNQVSYVDQDHRSRGAQYSPPDEVRHAPLSELLGGVRSVPIGQEHRLTTRAMFPTGTPSGTGSPTLHFAGRESLLRRKCVAVVGSRKATDAGLKRAFRLSAELVERGVVVVSGLAEGIDTAAHTAAITSGGDTIAVLGTPLDRAFPAQNARLQETIWRNHLLVSPFSFGSTVHKSNFPHRNKIMAALSDATVVMEASDTSGSLHQAAECLRIGRWLFIAQNIIDNSSITWPRKFLDSAAKGHRVRVLREIDDIMSVLNT